MWYYNCVYLTLCGLHMSQFAVTPKATNVFITCCHLSCSFSLFFLSVLLLSHIHISQATVLPFSVCPPDVLRLSHLSQSPDFHLHLLACFYFPSSVLQYIYQQLSLIHHQIITVAVYLCCKLVCTCQSVDTLTFV